MRRPLQVWLPVFGGSIHHAGTQRDIQRAFRAWRGESRLWLLPWLEADAPVRWGWPVMGECAIRSEHFNRIDVMHLGENGYLFGIGYTERCPTGRFDDRAVLTRWLNATRDRALKLRDAPASITLAVPTIQEGRCTGMAPARFQLAPVGTVPIVGLFEKERACVTAWPPPGGIVPPISPDAESTEYYDTRAGPLIRVEDADLPMLVSGRDPSVRALPLLVRWPDPLDKLYTSLATGWDDVYVHSQAISIWEAAQRAGWPSVAQELADLSAPYVSEGWTMPALAWFGPTGIELGFAQAVRLGARFNLPGVKDFEEAARSEPWVTQMTEPHPIRRTWGATGFMIALLRESLEDGRRMAGCRRCGRALSGKQQLCGRRDNDQDRKS